MNPDAITQEQIEEFINGEFQMNPFINKEHATHMINSILSHMKNGGHGSFVSYAADRDWSSAMAHADHYNLRMIYVYEKFHVNFTDVPSMKDRLCKC